MWRRVTASPASRCVSAGMAGVAGFGGGMVGLDNVGGGREADRWGLHGGDWGEKRCHGRKAQTRRENAFQ
jgi:hypothetical protein